MVEYFILSVILLIFGISGIIGDCLYRLIYHSNEKDNKQNERL